MNFFDRLRGERDEPQPELIEEPATEEESEPTVEEQGPVPMTPDDVDRVAEEIRRDRDKPKPPMVN